MMGREGGGHRYGGGARNFRYTLLPLYASSFSDLAGGICGGSSFR